MKKNKNKFLKNIFVLVFICLLTQIVISISAFAEPEHFSVCPLCSSEGVIICPIGYKAACENELPGDTVPKCIFYENKYVPGCWKFVGIKKIDFNLGSLKMPSTTMVEIIGGGETYTLNREIVGCKKL